MMYNFILGSDLQAGAYSVTINDNGQFIDINSGDAIGQLAPWPPVFEGFKDAGPEHLFQEEEGESGGPLPYGAEETIPPPLPEDLEDLGGMVEAGELFMTEVPDEESGTDAGTPADASGGGPGVGEDEASGHGESTPEDESSIAFGSEG